MVKVAMIQFRGHFEKEENIKKILHYSTEAARNGAKIICHQELATSLYFCFEEEYKHYALAETIPGPTTERVGELAKQEGVTMILPLYEKVIKGEYYNSAAVISPEGLYQPPLCRRGKPCGTGYGRHSSAPAFWQQHFH